VSLINAAPSAKTLLSEHFPAFASRLKVKKNAVARAAAASSSSSGWGSYWWIWLIVFTLTRIGSFSSHSTSPDRPQLNQEQRKVIDEYMKRRKEQNEDSNKESAQSVIETLRRGNPKMRSEEKVPILPP